MNRQTLVLIVLAPALALAPWSARAQNITCVRAGDRTICSNGQTFFQSGNMTLDTQGHVWTNLGTQTIGSHGELYTQHGPQVFDNRGNAWTVIGNQQVGPSGTKCAPVGTQVFCGR
jgi:hypothetical protein